MSSRHVRRLPVLALALTVILLLAAHASAIDLSLSQTDWSTAPPAGNVTAGQVVNVFARLQVNGGDLPAGAVTALLVNGTAVSWHNTTAPIPAGSSAPLWYSCVMPCGNISLEVLADPDGTIAETDEANNGLAFVIHVQPCEDDDDEPAPVDDQDEGTKSLYDYIPYVFVALVILVAALTAVTLYLLEKRRRDQAMEREKYLRGR